MKEFKEEVKGEIDGKNLEFCFEIELFQKESQGVISRKQRSYVVVIIREVFYFMVVDFV